ncbi:hypothetical protein E9229_003592 [Paeniglutamicibacter cryotolerans]|uniref:Uncharacterized protein n=1 Tax=Paeniglutamicibacter cryotolerans TaxID=670079 RepID=A0A839QRP3_9MICC|nr:hypothetical protein [Paeniglutamicibacter cryotolerans]
MPRAGSIQCHVVPATRASQLRSAESRVSNRATSASRPLCRANSAIRGSGSTPSMVQPFCRNRTAIPVPHPRSRTSGPGLASTLRRINASGQGGRVRWQRWVFTPNDSATALLRWSCGSGQGGCTCGEVDDFPPQVRCPSLAPRRRAPQRAVRHQLLQRHSAPALSRSRNANRDRPAPSGACRSRIALRTHVVAILRPARAGGTG